MSKRRKPGDWIRPLPGAGMTGDADRLLAQIQPEENPDFCCLCDDPECREWATLWTEPDPQVAGKRHMLCHVSECQINDP